MKLFRYTVTSLLLAGWFASAVVAREKQALATPDGFGQLAAFMANGAFDPNEPHPEVPGCFQVWCDLQYFHEVIMGWTPTEIQAEEFAARAFFRKRFGLDVEKLEADGRIRVQGVYTDPRIEYRLFHLAGQKVPSAGWEVHDGAYLAIVTDPAGIELGGELTGVHVPAGGYFVYGLYNIQKTLPNGKPSGRNRDPFQLPLAGRRQRRRRPHVWLRARASSMGSRIGPGDSLEPAPS